MKKTFLEWSVADKKSQQEKWAKEMLRIHKTNKVEWVPTQFLSQHGIYIPDPRDARYTDFGAIGYSM